MHVSKEVSATESLKKGNKWESEKQMLQRFDWDEFQAHIGSGRIAYRQDPHTPGVWQYKDTQDWYGDVTVARGSKWQHGSEMEPGEDEEHQFQQLYYQDAMGLGLEDIAGKGFGKGQGKGSGKGFGKVKGKGNGKGNKEQLALENGNPEDEEPTEEEEMKEALKKARKARDQVASAQSDLEEALGKASPKLSAKGKAAAQGWSASLSKVLVQLKNALSGKSSSKAAKLKELLGEAAQVVKGAKDEAKELKQLACKDPSVAGSKRSRSSR